MDDNFGGRLRKLVEATGMSVRKTSRAIGISYAALTGYLENYMKPDYYNLVKLADYFAVPLDYFAGRCTMEQAKEISENYAATFMALRRAPFEAYLEGRKTINLIIGEGEEPWPYNLMSKVFDKPWDEVISEDQIAGINSALDELTEREKDSVFINMRDGMTLEQAGSMHGVTRERERQILAKSFRKLRAPHRKAMMMYGKECCEKRSHLAKLRKELEAEEAELAELKSRIEAEKANISDILRSSVSVPDEKKYLEVSIEEMDLSVRSYNCLKRAGCRTLGDVMDLADDGKLLMVRNLGRRSAEEILGRIFAMTHKRYTLDGQMMMEIV